MTSINSKSSSDNKDIKILCVDDDEDILKVLSDTVMTTGFTPLVAQSANEALKIFEQEYHNIAIILCDFKMSDMTGFELRKLLLPKGQDIPFMVVSGFISTNMALEGLELKISSFLNKPIKEQELVDKIFKDASERIQLLRETIAIQNTFIEEATNIIEEVEEALLNLENDRENTDIIKIIARNIHTLKGSSGCLQVNTLTKYTHKYEDSIAALQKGQIEFTDEVYNILFVGLDRIKEMISSINDKTLNKYKLEELLPELMIKDQSKIKTAEKHEAESIKLAPNAPKKETPKQAVKETISVPIIMLDELSSFSGEITVLRNMINKIVRTLESQYTGNRDIQSLSELLDEMHKINGTIQTRITDLRKIPLSQSLKSIPRMIHDLCHDLKKKIDLDIEGENLRVDNSLATVCNNSLVHLVRNSADHGVEMPQERLKLGKKETGTICIRCKEDHEEVHIKIQDDGHGIDYQKIKAKALEKGLYNEIQLAQMTEKQILSIIFSSGFSTASQITNVSGRGVGMDMVKSSVDAVGGIIDIETKIGAGTTFTLKLPIPKSVLIINSLLVEAGGRCFAIPQESIIRILRVEDENISKVIQQIATGFILRWNNSVYPLLNLKTALNLKSNLPENIFNRTALEIIIVRSENVLYALLVDAIMDSEEIVVKRLQPYFNIQGIYTGATFMGDGSVGLILDIKGVAELCGVKTSPLLGGHTEVYDNPVLLKNSSHYQNYLLFQLDNKSIYGTNLNQVYRLEEIEPQKIQHSGAQNIYIYRNSIMPIHSLQGLLKLPNVQNLAQEQFAKTPIIVTQGEKGVIGLEVAQVLDIIETNQEISQTIRDRVGIVGNLILQDQTVTIVDLPLILESLSYERESNKVN